VSKGIYTAVSGAIAQTAKLDTIANNLANVNTPGFKRDSQLFREYLSAYEKEPGVIEVPRVPASIESFYDMQGGDKSYVDLNGTYTDFQQGSMKQTGNSLDLAIDGEGFMEVQTPHGTRLTRAGALTLDAEGQLVTKQGFPVLKEGSGDPAGRIFKASGGRLTVSENGEIFDQTNNLGKLSLVKVTNRDCLQKEGNNLYGFRENLNPQIAPAETAKVVQGFLEGSNVNPIREMTDMIATTRTFESTQKAISAYDEMHKRLVTEVPKIGQG
jgi:flagellar basal-body rod protein FlgF